MKHQKPRNLVLDVTTNVSASAAIFRITITSTTFSPTTVPLNNLKLWQGKVLQGVGGEDRLETESESKSANWSQSKSQSSNNYTSKKTNTVKRNKKWRRKREGR